MYPLSKSTKHMMVDIETLDSAPTAAVISIGARIFTLDGPGKGFEIFISTELAGQYGTVSDDTLKWWASQNARQQAFSGVLHPAEAFQRFCDFVKLHNPDTIWANSPGFDITILRHLAKQTNMKFPMHYRSERDCRTIFALGRELGIDCQDIWENKARLPHLALDDATGQAEVVIRILNEISSRATDSDPHSDLPPDAPQQTKPAGVSTAAATSL